MSISQVPSSKSSTYGLSSSDDSPFSRASAAESDANRRVITAAHQVSEAQKQAEEDMNQIRDSYERQSIVQNARNEVALEEQRTKGYEQIRNLQRAQQSELRRIRNDGEATLTQLKEHYLNTTHHADLESNEKLNQIEKEGTSRQEYAQKMSQTELDDLRARHETLMNQTRDDSERKINQLTSSSRKQYDTMKTGYEEALEQTQQRFTEHFNRVSDEANRILDHINDTAHQQLEDVKKSTSQKLTAYHSQKSDPFYRLMDIHARLHDYGNEFVLTATVPEYEQPDVVASIKGNNLVISGKRRNEEQRELDPGHYVGSASFQTFHENFPLTWPVESNLLSKEFDGDLVIIRVPKKNEYAFKTPDRRPLEKIRVEPPHFPEDIERMTHKTEKQSSSDEPAPNSKNRGSGTLS